MTITEIPAGDNETGEPTNAVVPESAPEANEAELTKKSGASGKGLKASCGERVVIWIILAVVAVVAIGGVTLTLVMESRKVNVEHHDDDYHYDDNLYGDDHFWHNDEYPTHDDNYYGEPIEDSPFEIDESLFSFAATEPYASVDDLRKDIEALAKTFANTVILDQANMYNYDHNRYNDDHFLFHGDIMPEVEMAMDNGMAKDSVAASTPAMESTVSSDVFEGVDDFETYQHEAGVVKDDLVKSNGAYVFAAVENRIEVWDLDGNLFEAIPIRSVTSNDYDIHIQAFLMNPEGNKLTVIASDWGRYRQGSLVDNAGQTQVTIFNIEGSSLTQISQTYIDGYHSNSYSVGNNVHVVTKAALRTWSHIDDHLSRWNMDGDLTNAEYFETATRIAEEKVIPTFVDKVVNLVTDGDEIFLAQLVAFPESIKDYKSITQVSSFDTSMVVEKGDLELVTSKSMVLQPGHTAYVYATNDWIFVADESYSWGLDRQDYLLQTMLLGFRLDGASSEFAAVGTMPGQLLSQFSIDFANNDGKEYVRVAVTQNFNQFIWWMPRPMPVAVPEPWESSETSVIDETESRTLNEVIIFEIPQVEDGSQKVNELVKLGSVELGKKDETITAVRFFDDISYVVTFERTDPFYVLDLSDPTDPKILGELEIPGFSQFMHPIKADNSMLITVGQDANESGMVTGFQISIFDSTVPTDPKLVDRLVIGNDGGSTGSESSWDERAFRYIQVGDVGRLIIPLYSYSWDRVGSHTQSFDGFSVFGVDLNKTEEMITQEININHYQSRYDSMGCYCSHANLPARSFVFDGNLMTMKSSNIVSTDLVSKETQWTLTLEDKSNCWC